MEKTKFSEREKQFIEENERLRAILYGAPKQIWRATGRYGIPQGLCLYGYSVDITDRKLAEEQARIHEERYRTAIILPPELYLEI